MQRRDFLQFAGLTAAGALAGAACAVDSRRAGAIGGPDPGSGAPAGSEDTFWRHVRTFYSPPADYIDLDHANTSPTARPVFDAFVERARRLSSAPAQGFGKMWTEELDAVTRPALASYLGTEPGNVAFMANTTAALNTVLHGFHLDRGDEILVTDHEYPDMVETILQRVKRDGAVMRTVRVPLPGEDPLGPSQAKG